MIKVFIIVRPARNFAACLNLLNSKRLELKGLLFELEVEYCSVSSFKQT